MLTTILVRAEDADNMSMDAEKLRMVMRPWPRPVGMGGMAMVERISSRARKDVAVVFRMDGEGSAESVDGWNVTFLES